METQEREYARAVGGPLDGLLFERELEHLTVEVIQDWAHKYKLKNGSFQYLGMIFTKKPKRTALKDRVMRDT